MSLSAVFVQLSMSYLLPLGVNQLFQLQQMVLECQFTSFSNKISGVGLSANERFFDSQECLLLKCFEMTGKVSVGNLKILFQ